MTVRKHSARRSRLWPAPHSGRLPRRASTLKVGRVSVCVKTTFAHRRTCLDRLPRCSPEVFPVRGATSWPHAGTAVLENDVPGGWGTCLSVGRAPRKWPELDRDAQQAGTRQGWHEPSEQAPSSLEAWESPGCRCLLCAPHSLCHRPSDVPVLVPDADSDLGCLCQPDQTGSIALVWARLRAPVEVTQPFRECGTRRAPRQWPVCHGHLAI